MYCSIDLFPWETAFQQTAYAVISFYKNNGIDLDKNAIQRIECGKRFVTDIELKVFAEILNTTTDDLLSDD